MGVFSVYLVHHQSVDAIAIKEISSFERNRRFQADRCTDHLTLCYLYDPWRPIVQNKIRCVVAHLSMLTRVVQENCRFPF